MSSVEVVLVVFWRCGYCTDYTGSNAAQETVKFGSCAFVFLEEITPVVKRILTLLVGSFTHGGGGKRGRRGRRL